VKIISGLCLAVFLGLTAAACGGDGKDTAQSITTPTVVPSTKAPAAPAGADKVVYHDGVLGNDVTTKTLPKIIAAVPAKLTCADILRGGKALGNTYPNGEEFFLARCEEVPRK
jgi:hypothetical protein